MMEAWKAGNGTRMKKMQFLVPSLKLTASLHLKMDGWNTIIPIGFRPIFRGELLVSDVWN